MDARAVDGADDVAAPGDRKLDEALEESFPASDPPATWSGKDRDPRHDRTDTAHGGVQKPRRAEVPAGGPAHS